jgi:hypothetical protein
MIDDFDVFSSPSLLHLMGHLGIEIAHVVKVTHHLCHRIVGLRYIVIDGLSSEVFVHPFPKHTFGSAFPFIVNPCGNVGLEGGPVGLQGDVFRYTRLADFCAFFFDDDLIASYQIFSLWDKTAYGTRRQ